MGALVDGAAFAGHSLGEYVAACLAGVMSLRDALMLIVQRGWLMQQMAPGAMLAVPVAEEQVRQFLTGQGIFAFFDAPWVPIYIAVMFFLHPLLGAVSIVFALIQGALAWFGHRHTVAPAEDAQRAATDVNLYVQGKLRNAEVLESMGMVENLLDHGQTALVPGTGHFSEQWALQTEGLGRRVVRTPWNPGWPMDMAAIEQALRDDKSHAIKAVFAVHTDTASSVTNDLAAVRRAMDAARHPALLVADVVASLGCAPYDMQALGADVTLGASQKGLMCPPGVGILALNERAVATAEANPAPRFYWDWARRRGEQSYRKFCGTPPQTLLAGMAAAFGLIAQEGLDAVHARHRLIAGAVQAAVAGWAEGGALDFFARDAACRSVSVTAITVPEGFDVDGFRAVARERFGVALAGGLGPLQGKAFRIGHLGDGNPANILGCLGAVEAALKACAVPLGSASGTARAIAFLAENG